MSKIKDEIKEKLELPGTTVAGVYQYFRDEQRKTKIDQISCYKK